ncbi:MAG: hypothetical protein AABY13_02070 [Nanoarchaeota archaeon]
MTRTQRYRTYIYSTLGFGLAGLLAAAGIAYFAGQGMYFLALMCTLALLVAMDNFFCGRRLRAAGMEARTHYITPPFLRKDMR